MKKPNYVRVPLGVCLEVIRDHRCTHNELITKLKSRSYYDCYTRRGLDRCIKWLKDNCDVDIGKLYRQLTRGHYVCNPK